MANSSNLLLATTLACLAASTCYGLTRAQDDELQKMKDELTKTKKELGESKKKFDLLVTKSKEVAAANLMDIQNRVAHHDRVVKDLDSSRQKILAVIVEALKDKESAVRRWAAEALGKLGPVAQPHVAELLAALKDPDRGVVDAATHSIRIIDPAAARKAGLIKD